MIASKNINKKIHKNNIENPMKWNYLFPHFINPCIYHFDMSDKVYASKNLLGQLGLKNKTLNHE